MSEYLEPHSVSRLVGAPPGHAGHELGGQLTERVRSHPYSVVLFDEVEKAPRDTLDLFLQIFDEGQLTDGLGSRCSFAHTVVILTSNLGNQAPASRGRVGFVSHIGGARGGDAVARREAVMDALRDALRPELISRLMEVVVFNPLDARMARQIAEHTVEKVRLQLRDRGIALVVSDGTYALLVDRGFDPRLGAREIERTVERLLARPIARGLLEGRIRDGATLFVDSDQGIVVVGERGHPADLAGPNADRRPTRAPKR